MKKKKEEQEAQVNDNLNNMSEDQKKKLQHDAINSALTQINTGKAADDGTETQAPDELASWDELSIDVGDWENGSEYTKFMAQMENKANDHAKKQAKQAPNKSKEQLEKEAKKKELDDAVESV